MPRRAASTRKACKSLLPLAAFVLRTACGSVRGTRRRSGLQEQERGASADGAALDLRGACLCPASPVSVEE